MRYFLLNKRLLKRLYLIPVILLAVLVSFLWQQVQTPNPSKLLAPKLVAVSPVNEPIQPIPLHIDLDEKKVKLGEKLFIDPSLSKDKKIACVSCHSFDKGGADRRARSLDINGQLSTVNTPTVFNSGFNFRLNWDGKDENLFTNVDTSLLSSRTMGATWEEVLSMLQNSPTYPKAFAKVYSDGITEDNVRDAIATFEYSLHTPNSRFDQFLRGNTQALTESEKEGYNLFKVYGCVSCHQGVNVGGNMFQKFGVTGDYFAVSKASLKKNKNRGNITKADLGRFNVTGNEKDRYVFRVPSLRNVELTSPYFHDGSTETLENAIAVMAEYQLGRPLSSEKINLIIQFLKTLTGEYKGQPLSRASK